MVNIIIAAVAGFAAGALLTALIYMDKVRDLKRSRGISVDNSKQKKAKFSERAQDFLHKKPKETVDSNITKNDIERQSRVGLDYHLNDLIDEARERKVLNHLIRVVINDYDEDVQPLWEVPELREYLYEFDKDRPEAVFFIEEKSLSTYIRIVREAKFGHFESPLDDNVDLETLKKELGQDMQETLSNYRVEAHLFFSKIIEDDRDAVIALVDDAMERIESALRKFAPPEPEEEEEPKKKKKK
jgi:hypothetical protein